MNKLHRSQAVSLFFATITLLIALAGAASAQFTPIRPPSVPLITRSPYISTWLNSNTAPGNTSTFWNGNAKGIVGMASIDGTAYLFLGSPGISVPRTMTQTQFQLTPTQSIYTFDGGGVTLTVSFLSPVEATDMQRLSIPLGYVKAQAKSSDGNSHTVKVYFDITGEWAHGSSSAQIKWTPETILRSSDGSGTPGSLMAWEVTPNSPSVLSEQPNEYPAWGTALLATTVQPGLTSQSGSNSTVRSQFVFQGALSNTNDTAQPRAININNPVFAYSLNLGTVTGTPSSSFTLALGHVRDPAVSYQGQGVPSLWKSYFGTFQTMLAFSLNDAPAAQTRANALDTQITQAATLVGGTHYAALCALALRQAFAGTELLDPTKISSALSPAPADGDPWLFMKEISSSGNVSTIDVVYPAFPAFLYTNPELVRLLIDPLIYYPESGKWPLVYAEHDIGGSYPNASGHNDGGGENMPVEETANLLIMADAYMRYTPVSGRATSYAQEHYAIFKQWANYLLTVPSGVNYPNALDPQYQNQTDDFTGSIAHSVNLSLKGIIAVGAMGQIASFDGNTADAAYYTQQAQTLIRQWMQMAQNSDSTHLLLQYQEAANPYSPDTTGEPDTAWSLKYNAFPDRLLGTNLISPSVLNEEAAFYTTKEEAYGIPLDYRNSYTKTDWELWTAAATDDPALRQDFIDGIYNFANTTPDRVPFTDWYEPATGRLRGFQARPVIGGVFAPLFQFTAAPTFSPPGGTYFAAQAVTISDVTPGVTIYYTTDGSTPTTSSPVYGGPINVSGNITLRAFAVNGSGNASAVNSAAYMIYIAPPLPSGSFEAPSVGSASYQYNPTGGNWTFSGYSGIQSNSSAFGAANAPDGTQTAFLQGYFGQGALGSISQGINFPSTGTYVLAFQAARRQGQVQPLRFSVDGVQVGGLLTPSGSSFGLLTTAAFAIGSTGTHTLALSATDNSGDNSTFVDYVTLTPTLVPAVTNGSFEAPSVGSASYQYNPTGGNWTFSGYSGIQSNSSAFGAANAPDGTQTAFLQGYFGQGALGSISQGINFPSTGTYVLAFQAARRQGQVQPLRFSVDGVQVGGLLTPSGSSFGLLTTAAFAIGSTGTHTLALSATDNSGDNSTFVDYVTLTPTLVPTAPTKLSATVGTMQVTLSWAASKGATSYDVYRSTTPGGEATPIAATGGPSFIDTGLTNGTTYYYQVAALNNSGTSGLSSEINATPQQPAAGVLLPTSEQTGYPWRYTIATPASNWFATTFDDSTWQNGPAGFGSINFGGSVNRTSWTATPGNIWIRRHFPITGSVPANQQFRVFYDEGCEIYINGVQAASTTGYVTTYVALPMNSAGQSALQVGDNVIAVHCTQTAGGQYIDVGIQTGP